MSTRTDERPTEPSGGEPTASDPRLGTLDWRRALAGTAVGVLFAVGLRRRSPLALVASLLAGAVALRLFAGDGRRDRTPGARARDDQGGPATVERTVTVDRPATELSALLTEPGTVERMAGGVATVEAVGDDRHRWTVDGPRGRDLTWETRLETERSGEVVRWRTEDGPAAFDAWTATLAADPGGRGTRVTLAVEVDPPGGALGRAALERLAVVPEAAAATALDRLKSLAETGEVPTLEANPSGRGAGDLV